MRSIKITQTITSRDEKSLDKYFTEISKYEVLSPEEEVLTFLKIQEGDKEALEKIVHHNLRFVVSVAKQYHFNGLNLSDLINDGNLGLIKAAKRFDHTRGFKFISYAVWWIRQSIISSLNNKSRKIRVPSNVNRLSNLIRKEQEKLVQKLEREPSIEELAQITEMSPDKIQNCLRSQKKCSSLDAPLSDDSDTSMAQILLDHSIQSPDYDLAHHESSKRDVETLLSSLQSKQASIISMYYGIGHKRQRTLQEIADVFGLSKERTRQIKDKGLLRLRSKSSELEIAY